MILFVPFGNHALSLLPMNRKTRLYVLLLLSFAGLFPAKAQAQPHLVGYLKNWQSAGTPFLTLGQADDRYDYLVMAFALPVNGTDYQMDFTPVGLSSQEFLDQVQAVQDAGKKVLLSIGGATAPISLNDTIERNIFAASLADILYEYEFDGLDIDLESASLTLSGGTISNPVDQPIILLIQALQTIMEEYRYVMGRKMILTFAPETAYVQGGQSAYNGVWGAYLPLIHALRDSIDLLQVQLYNSGSMYGIDGGIYEQGTPDFVISQTEAVIQGFFTAGGVFQGLPANKIAVGLPACEDAAGGGYLPPEELKDAMFYLTGQGPQPGAYTLLQAGGYPDLGGMMCWSINWDALESCNGAYSYAQVFEDVFETVIATGESETPAQCYRIWPNPAGEVLHIRRCTEAGEELTYLLLFDLLGRPVADGYLAGQETEISLKDLTPGMYILSIGNEPFRLIHTR